MNNFFMKMVYEVSFGVLKILIFISILLRYTSVLRYVDTIYFTFIVIQITGRHKI